MSIVLSPTGLKTIQTSDNWWEVENENITRLNGVLLHTTGLSDTNFVSLITDDYIQWDAGSGKFINYHHP